MESMFLTGSCLSCWDCLSYDNASKPSTLQEDANIRIPRLTHTHPSNISKHPLSEHYPLDLTDQGENLRGTPFNITVSWNIMPTVGRH